MTKRGRVYNRIFNEDEWEEVNKENKLMIEDFIEEYRQRKIKDSTIKQYMNDLRIVMIYILRKLENKSIIELNKKDFRRFSLYLSQELQVSNARANRLMSAVRSLLTYIEDDDDYEYDNNIAKKVKGLPKEAVKTNEDDFFLSFEQVMKLRNELIERDRLQDAVLLMVMFDSAARRNEAFQINKTGLLDGNRANEVVGKRGKKYKPAYLNDTKELISEYLKQRGEDDIESPWIVGKGESKRPVTYGALYDRVVSMSKVLSELEGKKIEFFPHSLRHSRIECLLQGEDTRILDKDGNPKKYSLEEVQLFANHSDPKTTQSYAKDHTDEIVDNMFGF
ncbi:tyrosine-type recombinase/integrase [Rossellomorea marisflavi]|uniref:Tyrosine-type recombinase/integrase n=1 Tax=Rossellomorea marisflavi TaxID=189381 RepID=A0A5D4S3W3_9BACI|nr:site-specific integrase [Rossellomorea marisflavi]TYS56446.1 tyrosine-type recombinase/integrase [Rossellomorea marisflavi]